MANDVARVFFHSSPDPRIPAEIRLQRLDNHMDNVARLVGLWRRESDDTDTELVLNSATASKVIEAAQRHDMGKPERFRIQAQTRKQRRDGRDAEVFDTYIYSFSGHRF